MMNLMLWIQLDGKFSVLFYLSFSGRFAKVCRVRNRSSGASFAAKIIRRWRNGKDTIDAIRNEFRVLEMGKCSPHITSVHQCYVRDQDVVIVLEQLVNIYLIHHSNVNL